MKRKIVAVVENHFDQIWRRCFRRDMIYKGQCFVSYEKIEQYYIDENIKLSERFPEYKFQIETPAVVENYLERFPERENIIKELYSKGALKTTNTGYAIIDSNMISAEAIIRNYLLSDVFFERYMGETPAIANRSDAFGNSAQLPQILKAFGARHVTEIYYNPYDDDVWVGLDGSAICVRKHPKLGGGGGWVKYKPCPTCGGFGKTESGEICRECDGRGINIAEREASRSPVKLAENQTENGVIRVGGEELLPSPETISQIETIAKEKNIDLSLGFWDYLLECYKDEIERIECGDFSGLKVRSSPEFNPNTTGGYVSRIKIKQRLCDTENKLLTGETLEALKYIGGKTPESYGAAWKSYLLCAFHDASYGTVVDPAYDEIMELFDTADSAAKERYLLDDYNNGCDIFNSVSGEFCGIIRNSEGRIATVKKLSPYSFGKLCFDGDPVIINKKPSNGDGEQTSILTGAECALGADDAPSETFTVENEYLTVVADEKGICSVTDKRYGVISDTVLGARPCEWIIQSDNGSPWATLEPPAEIVPLKDSTRFVRIEKGKDYSRVCYETTVNMKYTNAICNNKIKWSFILADGCERLIFDADVNWASCNKRLTVRFPLTVENGRDVYGIPGGMLAREPYEPRYEWNGANGDWPAFRFGGVENGHMSAALFNRGTPAYKILPEGDSRTVYMTVLRSPANPVYLHEPVSYVMTDFDGMRDEGLHHFDFALGAYGTDFASSNVMSDAESFSRPPLPVKRAFPEAEMPSIERGDARITHVKPAEDGNGITVRVTEYGGSDGTFVISVPKWAREIKLTDMPERHEEKLDVTAENRLSVPIGANKIVTLKFLL